MNGIPFSHEGLNFGLAFYKTIRLQCDAFSFVETNLEWMIPDVTACMKMVANLMFGNVKTMQATSTQRFTRLWKPGGTLVAVHGDHAGSVIGQEADPLGRWSSLRISGKGDSVITMISAYRVARASKPGPSTAYAQQQSIMFATRGPKYRPRDACINDLITRILAAQAVGDHIIIGIDANEEMGSDRIGNAPSLIY